MRYTARRTTVFHGILSGAIIAASACSALAQDSGQNQPPKVENIEKRLQPATPQQQLEPLNPNVRDVTPKGVYRGQDWRDDKVERLPARPNPEASTTPKPDQGTANNATNNAPDTAKAEQDGDIAQSTIMADGKPVIWVRPQALSAGRVLSRGSIGNEHGQALIAFAGIKPLAVGETCEDRQPDQKWKCGRFAKGALALLLQGRSISCLPVKEKSSKFSTRCEIAGHDISVWLVRNGWAKPDTDIKDAKFKQQLDDALKYAKANNKGLWLSAQSGL